MKPPKFEYVAATSVDGALESLAGGGDEAKVLAGGQSLMPLLAFRFAQPSLLVDLNRVAELSYVRETADGVSIGAMTRTHQLEVDPAIARHWPLAAAAAPFIGHRQIRNRGTIGGSIAHADPAAELPAVTLASRATLVARSPRGDREIPAADFFVTYFTTALEPDEILTEIRVPAQAPKTGVAFTEVARRHGDFALVGVTASVTLNGSGCADATVVLLGVADRPVHVAAVADILRGEAVTEGAAREAGDAAAAAIDPAGDLHASAEYRKEVAAVLTRRALLEAAAKAAA